MRHRTRLNIDVTQHLLKIKGLGRTTIHHQMRRFEDNLKLMGSDVLYEYEDDPPGRDSRIRMLFERKKTMKRQREIRPGTLKSSDERTKVIEASGRLVIPKRYYDRAVEVYDGSQIIIKDLNLRETEEMTRNVKRLIDRVVPPPKLRVKSRVYSPLTSPLSRAATPMNYERKCNDVLKILEEEMRSRSMTPNFKIRHPTVDL